MTGAPRLLTAMIRDRIAPALREMGFTGHRQLFRLDDDLCWARLGLQRGRGSSAESVRFTVNLCVANRDEWANNPATCGFPEGPEPGTLYVGSDHWLQRLGLLFPTPSDHWWEVHRGQPTDELAEDLVALIQAFGVPALVTRRAEAGARSTRLAC